MGHLRKLWLQMNCFVSKQPILGELTIIMKPSSITAAFQQLAGEPGDLGKQQRRAYHFLKLLTLRPPQKSEIPVPGMLTLRCQLGRARFPHLFRNANLRVAGQALWRADPLTIRWLLVKEMIVGHQGRPVSGNGSPKEQN